MQIKTETLPRKEVLIKGKQEMNYNITETKEAVLKFLHQKNIEFEQHNFDSGCSMIDFKIKGLFYVIQIEHDSIGISLVEESDFSTIPDERFYELPKFLEKIVAVLA